MCDKHNHEKILDSLYCDCGAIVIDGNYIKEENVKENNKAVKTQILAYFPQVFASKPSSIKVSSFGNIAIKQVHSSTFDIFCTKCGCGFRIVLGRDHAYSCHLDDCCIKQTRQFPSIKRPLTSYFPLALRRFLVEREDKKCSKHITQAQSEYISTVSLNQDDYGDAEDFDDFDDVDFQLMFSAHQECIVGSFRDQWILHAEYA